MNKIKRIILCLLFILLCIIVIPSLFYKDKKEETSETTEDNTNIMEENRTELTINVLGDGECIYDPGSNQGYRYGPSMLINEDGSIDAWFSRPGNNGSMWDYICYRHMDVDGNWGSEEIVLKPTSGGLDAHSVCDPGVIYFGGYYYIGYTGTIDGEGLRNQIFVARSKEPNGKYEKWNGSSWGGDHQPIIRYEGNYWGVGEISFVE